MMRFQFRGVEGRTNSRMSCLNCEGARAFSYRIKRKIRLFVDLALDRPEFRQYGISA